MTKENPLYPLIGHLARILSISGISQPHSPVYQVRKLSLKFPTWLIHCHVSVSRQKSARSPLCSIIHGRCGPWPFGANSRTATFTEGSFPALAPRKTVIFIIVGHPVFYGLLPSVYPPESIIRSSISFIHFSGFFKASLLQNRITFQPISLSSALTS